MLKIVRINLVNHHFHIVHPSLQLFQITFCTITGNSKLSGPLFNALLEMRKELIIFEHANKFILAKRSKNAASIRLRVDCVLFFYKSLSIFEIVAASLEILLELLCQP